MTFMRSCLAPIAGLLLVVPGFAQSTPQQQLARDVFKQLIEINTTDSVGDNTKAAEAMAARFRAAGYPDSDIQVLGPAPRKGNMVVRLHGTGPARPILFIGHLDVVEAKRSDWSVDPFQFIEKDGYFYGRGTSDMKGDDAILVTTFLRLKREGFHPSRDMILALTSDEEGGNSNGVDWLVKNHPDLIDAEFCVNSDGGGGVIKSGTKIFMGVQAAEKVFLSFKLEVTNPGGHSSLPKKDNAIYHLADGLSRLARFDFPVRLFDVTRDEFERTAALYPGELGSDLKAVVAHPSGANQQDDAGVIARLSALPLYNALLRTTCVPTMMTAGHAENALPQSASAVINCRLIPVDDAENVEATLRHVLADPAINITVMTPAKISKYIPMNQTVLAAVTSATAKYWPGLPIVPLMTTGASDGVYLNSKGIPTYGVSGIFGDQDDVRAHGRDERVMVKSFYDAVDFIYDVATTLGK
jgi:acetylornithine deacetylase/succinyl-diaminopimelate desuccinylase-like protein